MMLQHRDFRIYGEAEPVVETLLGRISQWFPKGSIDYTRPRGSLVELTRFQLPSMKLNEKELAQWFALEFGRLLVDICHQNLLIARAAIEGQLVMRSRSRH
jgi:hypothetical protein